MWLEMDGQHDTRNGHHAETRRTARNFFSFHMVAVRLIITVLYFCEWGRRYSQVRFLAIHSPRQHSTKITIILQNVQVTATSSWQLLARFHSRRYTSLYWLVFSVLQRCLVRPVFVRYNTALPSLAPEGRLSSTGLTFWGLRSPGRILIAENFEQLVFIKGNLHLFTVNKWLSSLSSMDGKGEGVIP